MLLEQKKWCEVSKSNPCPLCDRASWCYSSENREAVVCGRTSLNDVPIGWKYLKDAIDGRAIFVIENAKRSNRVHKSKPSASVKQTVNHQNLTLAKLPTIPTDRPLPKSNPVPQWLVSQGVPASATETRYHYSKTQWVSRFEWLDPNHPKGHDKTIRQGHYKRNGQPKWSKGDGEWLPYRFDEAITHANEKWLLVGVRNV
jgi:putative DNA primase/helicase